MSIQQEWFACGAEALVAAHPAFRDRAQWEARLDLLPKLARAGENIERQLGLLVFVRRLPPFEFRRILRADFHEDRDRSFDDWKHLSIQHVYLTSTARLLRVFLECGFEDRRPEVNARKIVRRELFRQRFGIDPRRANQL